MDWFHLVPFGVGTFIGSIITGLTALVLLRIYRRAKKEKDQPEKAPLYLAIAFGFWSADCALVFAWYVLYTPWSPHLLLFQPFTLAIALAFLIRFSYSFLENLHPREGRVVFALAVFSSMAISIYIGLQVLFNGEGYYVPRTIVDLIYPLEIIWATTVFLRKWHKSREHRRVYLYFAGLHALLFLPALTNYLALTGVISHQLHVYVYDSIICLYPPTFSMLYIRFASKRLSVGIKLVGASLITVLAGLGLVGVFLQDPAALQRDSGLVPPQHQSIVFEPGTDDAAYQVSSRPFRYTSAHGTSLTMDDRENKVLPLAFSFPFFDASWDTVYVSDNGVVTFGAPPCLAATTRCFYSDRPTIAPLYADFDPARGKGVFYRSDAEQLVITWLRMPIREMRNGRATVQLTLHRSGVITFTYGDVDVVLQDALRGVHPGGDASVTRLSLASALPLTLSASQALAEDYALTYRRFAGHSARWLYMAIIFFTLVIPAVFLLIARISVLTPVRELQVAAEQINQHKFDPYLPARRSKDEISDLRNSFVQMADELKRLVTDMEQTVNERTAEVRAQKKLLEEQTRMLEETLQKLEHERATQSRFLGNISHEFRTPLTLIRGPIQDAQEAVQENPALSPASLPEKLEIARYQSIRLEGLINQLLELARPGSKHLALKAQRRDIISFLKEISREYLHYAEREHVEFLFDPGEKHRSCPLYFDPPKLGTAVRNLLANAFKFTPSGKEILLAVTIDSLSTDEAPEGSVEIKVKNTGSTIPKGEWEKIFDRFYQLAHEHEGVGIGLALTKEIVELHHGRMGIDSDRLSTTFTITLPKGRSHLQDSEIIEGESGQVEHDVLSPSDESIIAATSQKALHGDDAAQHEVDNTAVSEHAETILVVEDNADVRAYLRMVLEESGQYRVGEAKDGVEGLEKARELEPDLILTDVWMPNMDGFALCDAVMADPDLEHIPLIMLTARATTEARKGGFSKGADDYVFKPFDKEELIVRIQNLIAKRRRLKQRYSEQITLWLGTDAFTADSAERKFFRQVTEIVKEMIDDRFVPLTATELVGRTVDKGINPYGVERDEEVSTRTVRRWYENLFDMTPGSFLKGMCLIYARQMLERQIQEVTFDPAKEPNPKAIADKLGWTLSDMRKKFCNHFDISIDDFISTYEAKHRLDSGQAAEEVAHALGYADVEAFKAVFSKVFPDWPDDETGNGESLIGDLREDRDTVRNGGESHTDYSASVS